MEERIYEVKKQVTIQVAMGWKLFFQLPGTLGGSWSPIYPESNAHRFTVHPGVLIKSDGGQAEGMMLQSLVTERVLAEVPVEVPEPASGESEQAGTEAEVEQAGEQLGSEPEPGEIES